MDATHHAPIGKPTRPITRINLKLLQTFVLVAEHGSFRDAAIEARRSQSAISVQIKQLEEQLGLSLFSRTTREVKLTSEGRQLLLSTQRAFQEVAFGLQQIEEAAEISRTRVLLGCSPSIACTHLPRILATFEDEYPGTQVLLGEQQSVDLVDSLRKELFDFCVAPVVDAPDLEFEPLLEDQLCALVPNSLARGFGPTITLQQLSKLPLLHFHSASKMAQISESAALAHGIHLNIIFRCIQAQTLVAMAEAGLGAAILRQSLAEVAHSPSTRKLLIVEPVMSEQFGLVRLKGKSLSPAATRLLELIRESMQAHRERRAASQKSQ